MEFLKLLQFIADAIQWRARKDRKFFEEIVQPLFEQAEAVFNDFVRIFDKLIEMLDEGETGLEEARRFLLKERRLNQSTRTKVRETIKILKEKHTFSSESFERGLEGILCANVSHSEPSDHVDFAGYYQKNHTILGFLSEVSNNEVPAHMLPDFCRAQSMKQLEALETSFSSLTAGYLELKKRLL
ncbi:hypothetical protein [Ruegeria hyattellae]|uniref:hypothetical protein n=1 Tax=Ruegeria hyattellae TaxID=3233337 RepID=UPI00355C9275